MKSASSLFHFVHMLHIHAPLLFPPATPLEVLGSKKKRKATNQALNACVSLTEFNYIEINITTGSPALRHLTLWRCVYLDKFSFTISLNAVGGTQNTLMAWFLSKI